MNRKGLYDKAALLYVKDFAFKHDLIFDEWIGGEIGGVAIFADYFIDYRDIRHDMDNNIYENLFFQWYDYSVESEASPMSYDKWLRNSGRILTN